MKPAAGSRLRPGEWRCLRKLPFDGRTSAAIASGKANVTAAVNVRVLPVAGLGTARQRSRRKRCGGDGVPSQGAGVGVPKDGRVGGRVQTKDAPKQQVWACRIMGGWADWCREGCSQAAGVGVPKDGRVGGR
eukprot:363932-Chlamydomonas_euryale.AAC.18